MVAIHIISSSKEQADDLVNFLLKEDLLFEAVTIKEVQRKGKAIGIHKISYLIVGVTKALLFKHIYTQIKERYNDKSITIYSLPVVDMEPDKQKELIQKTRSI